MNCLLDNKNILGMILLYRDYFLLPERCSHLLNTNTARDFGRLGVVYRGFLECMHEYFISDGKNTSVYDKFLTNSFLRTIVEIQEAFISVSYPNMKKDEDYKKIMKLGDREKLDPLNNMINGLLASYIGKLHGQIVSIENEYKADIEKLIYKHICLIYIYDSLSGHFEDDKVRGTNEACIEFHKFIANLSVGMTKETGNERNRLVNKAIYNLQVANIDLAKIIVVVLGQLKNDKNNVFKIDDIYLRDSILIARAYDMYQRPVNHQERISKYRNSIFDVLIKYKILCQCPLDEVCRKTQMCDKNCKLNK